MDLHGDFLDLQTPCDLLVGIALSQEGKGIALSRGKLTQRVVPGRRRAFAGIRLARRRVPVRQHDRRHIDFPGQYQLQGIEHGFAAQCLRNITGSAGGQRREDIASAHGAREDHRRHFRKSLPHQLEPGESIHSRHFQIKDDEVELRSLGGVYQRFLEGRGLDHRHLRGQTLQIKLQAVADQLMVVRQEHMHFLAFLARLPIIVVAQIHSFHRHPLSPTSKTRSTGEAAQFSQTTIRMYRKILPSAEFSRST